jgi:hypothetical protein
MQRAALSQQKDDSTTLCPPDSSSCSSASGLTMKGPMCMQGGATDSAPTVPAEFAEQAAALHTAARLQMAMVQAAETSSSRLVDPIVFLGDYRLWTMNEVGTHHRGSNLTYSAEPPVHFGNAACKLWYFQSLNFPLLDVFNSDLLCDFLSNESFPQQAEKCKVKQGSIISRCSRVLVLTNSLCIDSR